MSDKETSIGKCPLTAGTARPLEHHFVTCILSPQINTSNKVVKMHQVKEMADKEVGGLQKCRNFKYEMKLK